MADTVRKKKKKKHPALRVLLKVQFILLFLVVLTGGLFYCFGGYAAQVKSLRDEAYSIALRSRKEDFTSSQSSIVYAADGTVISKLVGEKDSHYIESSKIPEDVKQAILSIEDKRFYLHNGVDAKALLRALLEYVRTRELSQGGSTITMQLAKNIYLTQEKTWERKIEEIFLAIELEKKYSKEQLLEFYLNNINFGNGYYGIQAASLGYFNKGVSGLSLSETALLCAVPNNPSIYDPLTHFDNAMGRQGRILKAMLDDGRISNLTYARAVRDEVVLHLEPQNTKRNYIETYVYNSATRALMEKNGFVFRNDFADDEDRKKYDERYAEYYTRCQKELYTGGYFIHTSLDLALQEKLQDSIDEALAEYTEQNGEGVFTLQSAAVCIDNETGFVKAIVGGRGQELKGYTLNRAYQSYRQPGSAIKPLIVYTPAFEDGYLPDSLVVDEKLEGGPKNANGTYLGEISVRTAVEKSVNVVAWKLFDELTPQRGLSYLKRMNFNHIEGEDYRPASSLGGFTTGVSALEMAAAYAALENDGKYRRPTCIVSMADGNGNRIYDGTPQEREIYRQSAARLMTDVMRGVLVSGTGKGLALTEMPAAGKTGTTNQQKDGWFVGYTRYYTTSVWVGYDLPQKVPGLSGSSYPGVIWKDFMEKAHEGLPVLDFLPLPELEEDPANAFFTEEGGALTGEDGEEILITPGGFSGEDDSETEPGGFGEGNGEERPGGFGEDGSEEEPSGFGEGSGEERPGGFGEEDGEERPGGFGEDDSETEPSGFGEERR